MCYTETTTTTNTKYYYKYITMKYCEIFIFIIINCIEPFIDKLFYI